MIPDIKSGSYPQKGLASKAGPFNFDSEMPVGLLTDLSNCPMDFLLKAKLKGLNCR